jgi:hypothetical protein
MSLFDEANDLFVTVGRLEQAGLIAEANEIRNKGNTLVASAFAGFTQTELIADSIEPAVIVELAEQ